MTEFDPDENETGLEIMDRITAEHFERGHNVGPIAGCAECLRLSKEQSEQLQASRAAIAEGGVSALETLALQQLQAGGEARGVQAVTPLVTRESQRPVLREVGRKRVPPRHSAASSSDGADYVDLADTAVRAAMECLTSVGAQATQEGIVHALVANCMATLALEQTMRQSGPRTG